MAHLLTVVKDDFWCLNSCGLYWNYTNKPSGIWISLKTRPGSCRLFVVDTRVRRPMCQHWPMLLNSTKHCLPLRNSEVWRSVVVTFLKIHLCHVVKCLVYLPRIKNYEYQDFWDWIGFIIQRNVSTSCTTILTLSKLVTVTFVSKAKFDGLLWSHFSKYSLVMLLIVLADNSRIWITKIRFFDAILTLQHGKLYSKMIVHVVNMTADFQLVDGRGFGQLLPLKWI